MTGLLSVVGAKLADLLGNFLGAEVVVSFASQFDYFISHIRSRLGVQPATLCGEKEHKDGPKVYNEAEQWGQGFTVKSIPETASWCWWLIVSLVEFARQSSRNHSTTARPMGCATDGPCRCRPGFAFAEAGRFPHSYLALPCDLQHKSTSNSSHTYRMHIKLSLIYEIRYLIVIEPSYTAIF